MDATSLEDLEKPTPEAVSLPLCSQMEWPDPAVMLETGHDYVLLSDSDLVNATHNYYDRIMAPEFDAEHSYAFDVTDSIRPGPHELFDMSFFSEQSSSSSVPATAEFGSPDEGNTVQKEILSCAWNSCDWKGHSPSSLGEHVENKHVKGTAHKICLWKNCRRAGRTFSRRYQLVRHIRTHTLEKPFKCPTCFASFATKDRLSIHTQSAHLKSQRFQCGFCSKRFFTSADRCNHEKRVHKKKRLLCSLCRSSFASTSALRNHRKRSHNYSMESRGFKSIADLRRPSTDLFFKV